MSIRTPVAPRWRALVAGLTALAFLALGLGAHAQSPAGAPSGAVARFEYAGIDRHASTAELLRRFPGAVAAPDGVVTLPPTAAREGVFSVQPRARGRVLRLGFRAPDGTHPTACAPLVQRFTAAYGAPLTVNEWPLKEGREQATMWRLPEEMVVLHCFAKGGTADWRVQIVEVDLTPEAYASAAGAPAPEMASPGQPAVPHTPAPGEDCLRETSRDTFDYRTPPLKSGDPRAGLFGPLTAERRRALHAVIWPSDSTVRGNARDWLRAERFDCLEMAFADLQAARATYPSGESKLPSLLGGFRDAVESKGGMTAEEIAAAIKAWKAQFPSSMLADVAWPRMLVAAAWERRGEGLASTVSPAQWRDFRELNALADERVARLPRQAREHLLGQFVLMRSVAQSERTFAEKEPAALAALARFPSQPDLAVIVGQRALPQWGGSVALFEGFARRAASASGPAHADRTYAALYTRLVPAREMFKHPSADRERIARGLGEWAESMMDEHIVQLQVFGCVERHEAALRRAQALWERYAQEPQLRAPLNELDADCRRWAATLRPPVRPAR
jgi:hypothetical protein